MSSLPRIFDPGITAQPCRSDCRAHRHAPDLVDLRTQQYGEQGEAVPAGWTAQKTPWAATPAAGRDVLWFLCDGCEDVVNEYELEQHVCVVP